MNVTKTARAIRNLRTPAARAIRNLRTPAARLFNAAVERDLVARHSVSEDARLFACLCTPATHIVTDLNSGGTFRAESEDAALDQALRIQARGHTARVELTEVGEIEAELGVFPFSSR